MATVQELIERYPTDKALQKEIDAILKDGKVSPIELMAFARKYDVDINFADIPKYLEEAKKLGLIK